jgi:hypothetical protein
LDFFIRKTSGVKVEICKARSQKFVPGEMRISAERAILRLGGQELGRDACANYTAIQKKCQRSAAFRRRH